MVLSDGAANAAVAAERASDARPSLRGRGTIVPDCRWAWDATAQGRVDASGGSSRACERRSSDEAASTRLGWIGDRERRTRTVEQTSTSVYTDANRSSQLGQNEGGAARDRHAKIRHLRASAFRSRNTDSCSTVRALHLLTASCTTFIVLQGPLPYRWCSPFT